MGEAGGEAARLGALTIPERETTNPVLKALLQTDHGVGSLLERVVQSGVIVAPVRPNALVLPGHRRPVRRNGSRLRLPSGGSRSISRTSSRTDSRTNSRS